MADNKKSFVLYADLIHTVRKLPPDKAGELFLTILEYVNDLNPTASDPLVDIAFEPIKHQMKRDLKKYEATKEQRAEFGRRGGLAKASKSQAKASLPKQDLANVADNVNDTVTDNVNDINNIPHEKNENSDRLNDSLKTETGASKEADGETKDQKAPKGNSGAKAEPVELNHVTRFRADSAEQERAFKFIKNLGRGLPVDRIKELAEAHDLQHSQKHTASDYKRWCEYFLYFLKDHREPTHRLTNSPSNPTQKRVTR